MSNYNSCTLCSRECRADRNLGNTGFCGESSSVRLAWAGLHFGEEPPLTGEKGSGALFFSGCTLKCPFCQNWQISHKSLGKAVNEDAFVKICTGLESRGAANINFITGSHFTPTLTKWMKTLRTRGITIPFMWNSSGFDSLENLKNLARDTNIFLPDLKTIDPSLSLKLFGTRKYPETAKNGLLYLAGEKPYVFDSNGLMKQGVIVRHLVMPGLLENTREVLKWFSKEIGDRAYLSIMSQYTPVSIPGITAEIPKRHLTEQEYDEVISILDELGIENGFIQEPGVDGDWLPDFTKKNPFNSNKSTTIWNM